MTRFDMLLRGALMDANLDQYEAELADPPEPDFSPRYLRERMRLLADPWGWARRRERLDWRLAAAAAALLILSACAVAVGTGQFSQWFPRLGVNPREPAASEEALTRAGTAIGQSQTVGDVTVTLNAAVLDRNVLRLSLVLTAPEIPEELTPNSDLAYAVYTEECYTVPRQDQWLEHLRAVYAGKGLSPEQIEDAIQNGPYKEASKYYGPNFILLSREGDTLTFEVDQGFFLQVERPELTLHLENIAIYEDGRGEGVTYGAPGERTGPGPGAVLAEGPFDFTFTLDRTAGTARYTGAGVEAVLSGVPLRFTGVELSALRLTAFYELPEPGEWDRMERALAAGEGVRGLWTEDGAYLDLTDASSFGGEEAVGRDYPYPIDPASVTAVDIAGTRVELSELERVSE